MSTEVREELDRIDQNIANTYDVLEQAGAEMPQSRNSDNLPETAASISAVLYGKKQSLTDEQKEQARQNLGIEGEFTGETSEVKPSQVFEAIVAGRDVIISHVNRTFGLFHFTSFDVNSSMGVIFSSAILTYNGMYAVVELGGYLDTDKWEFVIEQIPIMSDIPSALIGTTAEITPSQVAEAIEAGRDVAVSYMDATYGKVVFTSFMRAHSFNGVCSSDILQASDAYVLIELYGNTSTNKWTLLITQLAQHSDIPVPVVSTTAETTPIEVYALMTEGKPFAIMHEDITYGGMLFNSFVMSQAANNSILSTTVFQIGSMTCCAQLTGSLNTNKWIFNAFELATTENIPSIPDSLKNPYSLTINGTSYDGSKAVTIESIKGDTGQRGTGLLAVTTAPSSYTTAVGGIEPKYRMAISTIKSQAGVTEVLLGDTVRYSYYHYPIAYLDSSYAYMTTRVSIRGASGAAGANGQDYVLTDADKEEIAELAAELVDVPEGSGSDSVPSYVREEAERVAKVVQSHQNANTLTFIAASDAHLPIPSHSQYQDINNGLVHAGQAMGLLRKQIHTDFCFYAGDMIWDVGETAETAMDAMRFVHEILSDGFNGEQFWAEGNHEDGYNSGANLTEEQIFANVGKWNTGAVFNQEDRTGGYCYRDFDDYKVRVICINTGDGITNISTKQNDWLAKSLEVPVDDGWGTILLSHCPPDWLNGNATESSLLMQTIKNASGIICCIHGHTHCYKIGTVTGTDIPRIAVPNICFARNNEYGIEGSSFGETSTYNKTANTANDTSFAVITIDRQKGEAFVDYYGARPEDSRTVSGLPAWKTEKIVNQVSISQQKDSNDVYNGTGYKDGAYPSDYGADGTDPETVVTGWIPYNKEVIYIKGATLDTTNSHVRWRSYHSNKSDGQYSSGSTIGDFFTIEPLGTDYYKLTPKGTITIYNYYRISLKGTGKNLIITHNEPIE